MFSITPELEQALAEYVAEKRGRNASQVVRNALYDYLTARGKKLERPLIVWGKQKKE